MKTLLLLRHAKSSRDDPALKDHDRPLNPRGERDAPRVGRLIRKENIVPERVVSSTALRARQTAEAVVRACGCGGETVYSQKIYLGGPEDYLAALKELPDSCSRAMIVGHNPDSESLLERWTGRYHKLPTAALVHLELPVARWRDLNLSTNARVLNLWRPKELSP